jgi:D-lactate dehydrogenase
VARGIASLLADNMALTVGGMRLLLNILHAAHTAVGGKFMQHSSAFVRRLAGGRLPAWNEFMPKGAPPLPGVKESLPPGQSIVYFPSCINRAMGKATSQKAGPALTETIATVLNRAGYGIIYPRHVSNLCCGMAFASKGFKEIGDRKARELEESLLDATHNGTLPVLVDTSPCTSRMKEVFTTGLALYEPVRFLNEFVLDRLTIRKCDRPIAIHTTCSSRTMGLEGEFLALARRCATEVIAPSGIGCCGWAGDRGFTVPELAASALKDLRHALPPECTHGYSTSRTCEIGLSLHSGVPYTSVVALVEQCTRSTT